MQLSHKNLGRCLSAERMSNHQIGRGPWTGALLRLFGLGYGAIHLTDNGLELTGSARKQVSFGELLGPVELTRRFGFSAISLPTSGKNFVVVGLRRQEASDFVAATNTAWSHQFDLWFQSQEPELTALAEVVDRLKHPKRYPSACLLQPFLTRANSVLSHLPNSIPPNALSPEHQKVLDKVIELKESPSALRDSAITAFMDVDLTNSQDFFDTIESNPLTPEQRVAVVTDEDATLILAGAGSGKTSVIVAKAAYLVQNRIRQPEEVLLLAFGNGAASEMAARIKERTGAEVDALTFHALGNRIIRQAEEGSPALAAYASDDKQFTVLLRDIVINNIATRPVLGALLLTWFAEYAKPYKSEWDFDTRDEYYRYVEAHELRTLKGDLVKSFEELEIANWLYLNSIDYQYEPDYEHDLPENTRTAYTPDFRLTESGVYIEHFGVRKSQAPNGSTILTTAPHVDRTTYLDGMEWKRKVHLEHQTILVETFSYEKVEGRLTEALEEKLAPYITPTPVPFDQVLEQLTDLGQVDAFVQVLGVFLRHFKGSKVTIAECESRATRSQDRLRALAFLKIFEPVLETYQSRLGERIDFEDMIARATEHVEAGRYQSPYRHLLIDEFQDISEGRARLLKALKSQHEDARVFAVGDDWQSIYRFAGSDIHLMRDFGDEFGGEFAGETGVHSSIDLGRTFRSVDKIALPARAFILQNPAQITKTVIPAGTIDAPAMRVAYYDGGQEDGALGTVLEDLELRSDDGKGSVLLLGRYNFVEPEDLPQLRQRFPELTLKFMTVHRSKGLEADHVVVLKASSGRMGFPSEIVDDPLLDLVLPETERFEHAEERRLFYVALTRARKSVTILVDRQKPSAFVRELIDKPEYGAIELGDAGIAEHRCGTCGGRMLLQKSQRGTTYYQCEHRWLCGESLRPCNACGKDLPVADKSHPDNLICSCGATFPACPKCSDGWLVERKGKWGPFLGCVKYPKCDGTKQIANNNRKKHRRRSSASRRKTK